MKIDSVLRWGWVAVAITAAFLLTTLPLAVDAQTETPEPTPEPAIPFQHIVAEGENLTFIAEFYATTVEELAALNNISLDAPLFVGQALTIPGQQGDVVATLYTVQVGDTLEQIAAVFNSTVPEILASNRRVNPYTPLLAGQQLNIVSRNGSALPQPISGTAHIVSAGESWATIGATYNLAPQELAALNERPFPSYLIPGERLRIPSDETGYRIMQGEWVDVQLRPLPVQQGDTVTIFVKNLLDGRPSGQFAGQTLQFFPYEDGFAALVGVNAFAEAGQYLLELEGSGSQPWRPFEQPITIASSGFGLEQITVDPELNELLTPELRATEDAFLEPIYTDSAPEPLWEGLFQAPVTSTIVTSQYGNSRSYNGGPVFTFHTGVDFAGTTGTPILAPANGQIVFADLLELRGFTVIVDHGAGVMSAYFHLSEIFVMVGDEVTQGQALGAGGSTGLSTGPHLHWEMRIFDTAVNGLPWLNTQYP